MVGVAGDQHPGQGAITGQPPVGLRSSGPAPPTSRPRGPGRPTRLSRSTVTVSCGPDPTSLGQPPPLQGSGGPTPPAHQRGAGHRYGRPWRRLGGPTAPTPPADSDRLRLQQPIHRDHPVQGRSQPQPPPGMPPLQFTVGAVRVGHQLEMAQDPSQPRRIQPTGRLHQHRLGLHGHLVGQVLGAMSQHPSMSDRDLPTRSTHRPSPPEDHGTGPGRSAKLAAAPGTQTQPGPQPGGGRANLLALFPTHVPGH